MKGRKTTEMNSKERLQRAIAGLGTDMTPVAPAYLSLYLDEQIQAHYVQSYSNRLAGGPAPQPSRRRGNFLRGAPRRDTSHPSAMACGAAGIDHDEDSRLRVEAILAAYQVFADPPDWIHTEIGETRAWAQHGEMRLEDGFLTYVDANSGDATNMQEPKALLLTASTRYAYKVRADKADLWDESAGLRTTVDVETLIPVRSSEELEAQGVFEVTRILARTVGDRVSLTCVAPTPFWSTYSILGFQGMMVMMREKPELFRGVMERRHQQRLEILKGLARAGLHSVWVEECLSSADLISPRDYVQFAFPTAQAFIADVNRLGLTTVFYYCGDVMPRLPWLRRLGMAALAVEESKKGFSVDIADVIAGLDGACCAFGNVDAIRVVHEGTLDDIEAEVRRQVALGRQARGFVLCQGSPFPLDTDVRKINHFIRCGRRWQC